MKNSINKKPNVKTAISIQQSLFEQAEALAKEMHISRSRLLMLALVINQGDVFWIDLGNPMFQSLPTDIPTWLSIIMFSIAAISIRLWSAH